MPEEPRFEDLLRAIAPQVLGALVRRYGHFDVAEDAVQEALMSAATQWPESGVPAEPRSWMVRVASRRMIDQLRSDQARRDRELLVVRRTPPQVLEPHTAEDDSLVLLFMCCHPALTPASQVALTLRAVGGLTTGEIAGAFLVSEATVGQRISRAKQQIKQSGVGFRAPPVSDHDDRVAVVLHVLYAVFNEGYASSSGDHLLRVDLCSEAVRLTRLLHGRLQSSGEVDGLLALMLLTDARRPARVSADGALVPLDEQDRSLWDSQKIAEGTALVTQSMAVASPGPYQLQAAIAAVHAEAAAHADTDWKQILALYELLKAIDPGPVVELNRAVAAAKVHGPRVGLQLLAQLETSPQLSRTHRLEAVRAHLLELAGDIEGALDSYRAAASHTANRPEQRYLDARATRLLQQLGARQSAGETDD